MCQKREICLKSPSIISQKKEINIFLNFIQEICKQPVAFGGNNSVGYGYCKITPMGEMKEKNNGK